MTIGEAPLAVARPQPPGGRSALGDEVASALHGRSLAVMLYGSRARGTARQDSDIDVLQLVQENPRAYSVGRVNVAQYLPGHLRALGRRGSLFVRHLIDEGRIVSDDAGVLRDCLACYEAPASYEPLMASLIRASQALDPSAEDADKYAVGLVRLGVYLLRTSLYVLAMESSHPTFDLDSLLSRLNDPGVARALDLRKKPSVNIQAGDLQLLSSSLSRVQASMISNRFGSVEALALAESHDTQVAALLTQVLSGRTSLEYTALALPPF